MKATNQVKQTKIQPYDRLKTLTLEEGFALIRAGENSDLRVMIDGAAVSRRSTRLLTFLTYGTKCSHPECTLVGTFFAIERNASDAGKDPITKPYHMNLWGITEDGKEVLFTHDHVRARSHGGPDALDNTRTMCCWHNWAKSKEENRLLTKLKAMAGIAPNRPNDGLSKKQRRRLKRAAAHAEFVAAVQEKVMTATNMAV